MSVVCLTYFFSLLSESTPLERLFFDSPPSPAPMPPSGLPSLAQLGFAPYEKEKTIFINARLAVMHPRRRKGTTTKIGLRANKINSNII
jgi:hypothetical protein